MSSNVICGTVFINGSVNNSFPEFIPVFAFAESECNKLSVWKTVVRLTDFLGFVKEPVLMKREINLLLVSEEHLGNEGVCNNLHLVFFN